MGHDAADDPYANVSGGSLNLKGTKSKKKRKKDKKGTKKSQSASDESAKTFAQPEEITKVDRRTESQKKFDAIKRQREIDRIKKKALKSHKEKVEDLNQYLDTISEHYDVPKVSWTK